jgi:hypothetical protein
MYDKPAPKVTLHVLYTYSEPGVEASEMKEVDLRGSIDPEDLADAFAKFCAYIAKTVPPSS